ncbi:Protein of unknown function, partial [Gryllus bimaculatus]
LPANISLSSRKPAQVVKDRRHISVRLARESLCTHPRRCHRLRRNLAFDWQEGRGAALATATLSIEWNQFRNHTDKIIPTTTATYFTHGCEFGESFNFTGQERSNFFFLDPIASVAACVIICLMFAHS